MKFHDIIRPIGLNDLCNLVNKHCTNSDMYSKYKLRPDNIIVSLDEGEGRTTILEYIADSYEQFNVMDFSSAICRYIEVSLMDGSYNQLKSAFHSIREASTYDNFFRNIAAIDIGSLPKHQGETQYNDFIAQAKLLSETAMIVFFVPSYPDKDTDRLISQLCDNIEHIRYFQFNPYSVPEIRDIIKRLLYYHNIAVKESKSVNKLIDKIITDNKVSTVKKAKHMTEEIIRSLILSGVKSDTINENSLKKLVEKNKTDERVKVK